jgi:hypothetical protein
VPDEQSNLNLPPAARRPNNRRRGRRGGRGRGRGPGPADAAAQPPHAGDVSNPPADSGAEPGSVVEDQGDLPRQPEEAPASAISESAPPAPAFEETAPPVRRQSPPPHRPERRPEPPAPRAWVKPADFRPAETSAIHQAVAHATEIAEDLRELVDRIDEILELVEVAERQKLVDERELDNLRRALRRIQPPRHSHGNEPPRSHSRGDTRPRHEAAPARHEPGPVNEPASEAPEASDARGRETGFREPHPEPPAEDHGESQGDPHPGESNPEA